MIEWIKKILHRRLDRKKQDVNRLRWQQVQLQKQLEQLKEKSAKHK